MSATEKLVARLRKQSAMLGKRVTKTTRPAYTPDAELRRTLIKLEAVRPKSLVASSVREIKAELKRRETGAVRPPGQRKRTLTKPARKRSSGAATKRKVSVARAVGPATKRKLRGKAKEAFLKRMALGRKKAAKKR